MDAYLPTSHSRYILYKGSSTEMSKETFCGSSADKDAAMLNCKIDSRKPDYCIRDSQLEEVVVAIKQRG
jgi:hypothetical protein